MSNPFDQLGYAGLDGLDGLEGLAGWSNFVKKVKHGIRKVAKVAAPIVAGVVAGPAAGAYVGKQILDHKAAKDAAKEEAKAMGLSWGQYKRLAEGRQIEGDKRLVKLSNNPEAPQIVDQAAQAASTLYNSPQSQSIRQQLLAQGYTPKQVEQMFNRSRPMQQIVGAATAGTVYGGVRNAGYAPPQAAAAARQTVQQMDQKDTAEKILPYMAMGVPLLMLAMG